MIRSLEQNMMALVLLHFVTAGVTQATDYPTKPIRLIVPFPAGGGLDITARTVASGLSDLLGQIVVIDNRGGANGIIGTDLVAKSAPDGYTLLITSTSAFIVPPLLYRTLPYDPAKELSPIVALASTPIVLVVNTGLPAKSLAEFVALAKSKPGALTMSSSGVGSSNHLAGELFQLVNSVKFTHVPYKGSSPALIDLMGGQVDMLFDQVSSSISYIKAGKLRALAITGAKRSAAIPDVPTMIESGLKESDSSGLTLMLGPGRLPRETATKLNTAANKTLAMPAIRERFAAASIDVLGGSTADLDATLTRERQRLKRVVTAANIKLE